MTSAEGHAWGVPPYGLVSLWEVMIRFRASAVMAVMASLANASMAATSAHITGLPSDVDGDREFFRETLDQIAATIEELPLSPVLRSQHQRLMKSVGQVESREMAILIREFCNNLMIEFTSAWFLMIPADRREFYEQTQPCFGGSVAMVFPEASQDIAAASRCLALDEWTAMVFHLMRVLEHGLHALASVVGLDKSKTELENWKNIIDQIEQKIREMEGGKKSLQKSDRLAALSAAAVQFRYFKDAWRNHVSHSRVSYDSHAISIWSHVKEFMGHVAFMRMLS